MGQHTPRPRVTADELAVCCQWAEDAVYALGCLDPDGDGHTSALHLQEWLELLYAHIVRRAEQQVEGQQRFW